MFDTTTPASIDARTSEMARRASAEALSRELCGASVLIHAAMAELVRLVAAFDAVEGWEGFLTGPQWLSFHAGFSLATGRELIRVGQALRELPGCAAAFAGGELSFDKLRAITRVATAADEAVWVELARQASASQLSRICGEYRRAVRVDDPEQAETQLARRGLWSCWDEQGMLQITALLPAEDGALVMAALESLADRDLIPAAPAATDVAPVRDPASPSASVRRADALVALCDRALSLAAAGPGTAMPRRLVVHVDAGVLSGAEPEGRCHVEGGPALAAATARRIGCDTEVVAITERDGLPIDVGRARRIVPTRLRRALQARDRVCRFPGCAVPAAWTHAHHIDHWATHDGPTNLANLVSLCGFHHRRHHDGAYVIRRDGDVELSFVRADGRRIAPGIAAHTPVRLGPARLRRRVFPDTVPDPHTAQAHDGGRFSMDHAVMVIADSCQRRQAEAGHSP